MATAAVTTPEVVTGPVTTEAPAKSNPVNLTPAAIAKVKEIMASVLDIAPRDLGEDQDLERLGMDSLMAIEAHHALCTEMNVSLADDLFINCKSIRDLHNVISPPQKKISHKAVEIVEPRSSTFGTDVNPVKFQDGKGLPLFLVHDGSGIAHPKRG